MDAPDTIALAAKAAEEGLEAVLVGGNAEILWTGAFLSVAALSAEGKSRRVHRLEAAFVKVRRLRTEKEARVTHLRGVARLGGASGSSPSRTTGRSRSNIPLEVTEESFPDTGGGIYRSRMSLKSAARVSTR